MIFSNLMKRSLKTIENILNYSYTENKTENRADEIAVNFRVLLYQMIYEMFLGHRFR